MGWDPGQWRLKRYAVNFSGLYHHGMSSNGQSVFEVLKHYPLELDRLRIQSLGNHGGYSGAQLWKIHDGQADQKIMQKSEKFAGSPRKTKIKQKNGICAFQKLAKKIEFLWAEIWPKNEFCGSKMVAFGIFLKFLLSAARNWAKHGFARYRWQFRSRHVQEPQFRAILLARC